MGLDEEDWHSGEEMAVGCGVLHDPGGGCAAGPGTHYDESWRIGRMFGGGLGGGRSVEGDGAGEWDEVGEGRWRGERYG